MFQLTLDNIWWKKDVFILWDDYYVSYWDEFPYVTLSKNGILIQEKDRDIWNLLVTKEFDSNEEALEYILATEFNICESNELFCYVSYENCTRKFFTKEIITRNLESEKLHTQKYWNVVVCNDYTYQIVYENKEFPIFNSHQESLIHFLETEFNVLIKFSEEFN